MLAIGDFLIKSPIFNPPIMHLHRYVYVCMHVISANIQAAKPFLHYFAKIYYCH